MKEQKKVGGLIDLRAGYAYGVPITDDNPPNPLSYAPGPMHDFALGAGIVFGNEEKARIDVALDYAMVKKNTSQGKYETTGLGIHSSFDYRF